MTVFDSKEDVKQYLVKVIGNANGTKHMELVDIKVLGPLLESPKYLRDEFGNITDLLEELVQEGKLVEIEYVTPGAEKVRSLYLPVNTTIRMRGPYKIG